jgi:hypothetical protein
MVLGMGADRMSSQWTSTATVNLSMWLYFHKKFTFDFVFEKNHKSNWRNNIINGFFVILRE